VNAQNQLFNRLNTLNQLPSLPHILLKLIEVCNRDNADLKGIADIVSQDPALSAKILNLVNSAYFGLFRKVATVSEAAVLVGISGIKNLAICACVVDAFPKPQKKGIFSIKKFWWHSLRCAFLARHMACEVDACDPDEAFLSGLLHDIGKAVLWVNFTKTYGALLTTAGNDKALLLEGEAHMGATHAAVGAWLLDRWQLNPSIADGVRYHHERPDRMAHAMTMVQIIYVANLLCQDTGPEFQTGLAMARTRFEWDAIECQSLIEKSDQEAGDVARSLDIDVDAADASAGLPDENDLAVQDRLKDEVKHHALLIGTLEGFLTAKDQGSVMKCIADGLNILFDIQRSLFFLMDEKKFALVGYLPEKTGQYASHHALSVSLKMDHSLLVKSLIEQSAMNAFSGTFEDPLTIIDEQLIRLLGGKGMVCLPLVAHTDPVGVLALGIDSDTFTHLQSNVKLLNVFIHKGALALQLEILRRRQLQLIQQTRIDSSSDLAHRVVHEVNNPLSIIKNYLKVLEMRMVDAGIDSDEIRIVDEEITRVGHLLKQLTAFSSKETPTRQMTDINALLSDIMKLTTAAMLSEANIHVNVDFDPKLPAIAVDPNGLKQVFINLIKNAAEAMAGTGGNIEIRTRRRSPVLGGKAMRGGEGNREYVEILFRDDGPGIDEAIKEKLFDPYISTKSGFHSGLGLSVVYHTIQSYHGTITCDSVPKEGTTFLIELPVDQKP
jgi:putative nucleotidyltransferase with HDIG domain